MSDQIDIITDHPACTTFAVQSRSFSSWNQFIKLAKGRRIFVELTNGYFVPVSRINLKKTSEVMRESNHYFKGKAVVSDVKIKTINVSLFKPW